MQREGHWLLLGWFGLALIGCDKPTVPRRADAPSSSQTAQRERPKGEPLRVLFLGNSLTAFHNLPGLVQAMAASGGVRMEVEACTPGGVNLEDHWNDGRCRKLLAKGRFDYVVLQQGPSTRPESRADLRKWCVPWAEEARSRGAKPAVYMVWPYEGQADGFALAARSYREGARAAGARLLPAGEAWSDLIEAGDGPALYTSDRLHPTFAGSFLAALVVARGLAGVEVESVPARLTLASGEAVELPPEQLPPLRRAARKAAAREDAARDEGKRP